jgi:hypothetical protein
MIYVAIFCSGFLYVAARAFQQQNVHYGHRFSIIPTSYLMACLEFFTISVGAISVINEDYMRLFFLIVLQGTGAWMGCWFAMWFHKKVHKRG